MLTVQLTPNTHASLTLTHTHTMQTPGTIPVKEETVMVPPKPQEHNEIQNVFIDKETSSEKSGAKEKEKEKHKEKEKEREKENEKRSFTQQRQQTQPPPKQNKGLDGPSDPVDWLTIGQKAKTVEIEDGDNDKNKKKSAWEQMMEQAQNEEVKRREKVQEERAREKVALSARERAHQEAETKKKLEHERESRKRELMDKFEREQEAKRQEQLVREQARLAVQQRQLPRPPQNHPATTRPSSDTVASAMQSVAAKPAPTTNNNNTNNTQPSTTKVNREATIPQSRPRPQRPVSLSGRARPTTTASCPPPPPLPPPCPRGLWHRGHHAYRPLRSRRVTSTSTPTPSLLSWLRLWSGWGGCGRFCGCGSRSATQTNRPLGPRS